MIKRLEVQLSDGRNIIHEGEEIEPFVSENGFISVADMQNKGAYGVKQVFIASYNPAFVICTRDATND